MLLNGVGANVSPDAEDIVSDDAPALAMNRSLGVTWRAPSQAAAPARKGGVSDARSQSDQKKPVPSGELGEQGHRIDNTGPAGPDIPAFEPVRPAFDPARPIPATSRIKRPIDAAAERRSAEAWAAKQAEGVAMQIESTIASTPQLGAVHPNVIMRLLQALMRILRMLMEKLGVHDRAKEGAEGESQQDDGHAPAAQGARFAEPVKQAAAATPSAQMSVEQRPQQAAAAVAQPSQSLQSQGMPAAPAAPEVPDILGDGGSREIEIAELITRTMTRLADDAHVRHRMEAVGENAALQTAVYMSAVVNRLGDRTQLVQDQLKAYGGALNLRLARYQAQCMTYGGHAAAARLLQIGVIHPADVSIAFAEEVKHITARFEPQLRELDLLRIAVTDAVREVYQCAADSPLQEQLLSEMEPALTDLFGKQWREALALERCGAAPTDEEVVADLQRSVEVASEATERAEAVEDTGSGEQSPAQAVESNAEPASGDASSDVELSVSDVAEGHDGDDMATPPMSQDEARARFALIADGSTMDNESPIVSPSSYERIRG